MDNKIPNNLSIRFGKPSVFLFVLYFMTYVISNINIDYIRPTDPTKHFVMVGIAIISLVVFRLQSIRTIAIFLPIEAIYFIGGQYFYSLMVIVFAAAIPLISNAVSYIVRFQKKNIVLLMFLIALIPTLYGIIQNGFDSLLTSYYGRDRLLLGYWHPKEAAACFFVPSFLYIMIVDIGKFKSYFFLFPLFFIIMGSKNIALAMLIGLMLRYYRVQFVALLTFFLLIMLVFILNLQSDELDLLNQFLSFRIDTWSNAIDDYSRFVKDDSEFGGDRLGLDSFYIEVFVRAGLAGIVLLSVWLFLFRYFALRNFKKNIWSFSAFCMMLSLSVFDSGFVSTGNLLHIFNWAVVCISLFPKLMSLEYIRKESAI